MTKQRKRKPVSAARIELDLWFVDLDAYYRYSAVPLGRKTHTVSDREWVEPLIHPDGHIEAKYYFTHTCRNDGAQRGDSEKFFRAVCNAAALAEGEVVLRDVRLINRTNFPESEPTMGTPTKAQAQLDESPRKYGVRDSHYVARIEIDEETARQFAEEYERIDDLIGLEGHG